MSLTPTRLIVSSHYGLDQTGERPNNFIVELPQSVSNLKNIELISSTITYLPLEPNFPVYESYLDMTLNGTPIQGNINTSIVYNSPLDLVTQLNTILGSGNGAFSFDATTIRLIYTPPNPTDVVVFKTTSTLLRRMGAVFPLKNDVTNTGAYTFPNPPIIIRTTCIYIASSTISSDAMIGGLKGRQDIVTQIPLSSGTYGTILNYQLSNDEIKTETYNSNINVVNFEILDDLFQPLPLSNNAVVSATLALQYEYDQNLTSKLKY
jgi:hypothetical protein